MAFYVQDPKDPQAVDYFEIDWTAWLAGDTISASTWTAPTGIAVGASGDTAGVTHVYLSGGNSGDTYDVVNQVTTTGGRLEHRTLRIPVFDK